MTGASRLQRRGLRRRREPQAEQLSHVPEHRAAARARSAARARGAARRAAGASLRGREEDERRARLAQQRERDRVEPAEPVLRRAEQLVRREHGLHRDRAADRERLGAARRGRRANSEPRLYAASRSSSNL